MARFRTSRQIKQAIRRKPGANPGLQQKLSQFQAAHSGTGGATFTSTPVGYGHPYTQAQSVAMDTAPKAPAAPAAPATPATPATPQANNLMSANPMSRADLLNFSSYNPASGQADPRDATYWSSLANLLASSQTDYAGEQLGQTQADIGYKTNLTDLNAQQLLDRRNTAEGLIGTGLLRSGTHNREQTELTGDYTRKQSDLSLAKSNEDAQRVGRMNAILSMLGTNELGLYSDAAGRFADAQAQAAGSNQPDAVADPGYATAPASTAPSAAAIAKAKKILSHSGTSAAAKAWARSILRQI